MADVNTQYMIDEIRDNIQTGDILKTKLVLSHLEEVDQKTRNRLIYELSRGDVRFTVPILLHLMTEHVEIADELPVIKETLLSNLLAYPELLIEFLSDPSIKDKTHLINVAGELRFEEAVPALLYLVANSQDESEIKRIIETLGMIGDPQAINTLTDYLYAANRDLIITAIQALGHVATQSAMHRLAERMGTDNEMDYMILSIFADVQDPVSLEKLNDTLASHYAHMRIYAKQELVRIGSKSVPALIENLLQDDPDFIIHTLNVLGDIGDESAIMPIRKLLGKEPKNANVRFAAYEALALLPLRKGAYTLTAGLTDAEDHVCVAAARAIDQNYSEILTAGIKNLLRNKDDEARHITKIIVNAQVDKVFLSLVGEDFFQELSLIYLPHAHKDTREHYIKILEENGFADFAGKLKGDEIVTNTVKVVAVDDSRMILNIYKSTLHELGFEPVLFEFPATAIEWLQKEKPAMVLTDLNMPEITGIMMSAEIRKKYSPKELPIIMVTTQNESNDHDAAYIAGVNKVIQKPFNAKSLKAAMGEYL
ncbi:MAG: response regulator [Desulfocapsa sp.]|uniref:Response regulator n=1 Tax=Desulfotalea psychrophila TaxID=84980 RepID=A0ABS3ATM2_9BACT|nr:response regulator [Desulfocapsa sp.]MBN4068454.1 response regulator [Desulfotalea psychrophila]